MSRFISVRQSKLIETCMLFPQAKAVTAGSYEVPSEKDWIALHNQSLKYSVNNGPIVSIIWNNAR